MQAVACHSALKHRDDLVVDVRNALVPLGSDLRTWESLYAPAGC
jgi:hypothetical protein